VGSKLELKSRPSRRQWRAKKHVHKMVLGADVGLPETCGLALCGLVGRLSYPNLCKLPITDWVNLTWKPILGYTPEVVFLNNGWLGFLCKSPEDSAILLEQKWMLSGSSLMLKRWRLAFNPETEYFQYRHLWILLPALPLQFWNKAALEAIGNSLGSFLSVDNSSLLNPSRKIGKVLVEMNIHGGLPELLEIEWRGKRYSQRLDYLGIPFRCSHCHSTGHLKKFCRGQEEKEAYEDSALYRDLVDLDEETQNNCHFTFPESSTPSDSDDSLSSKLKNFCLAFYHSLSFLELENLKASQNLQSLCSPEVSLSKEEAIPTLPESQPSFSELDIEPSHFPSVEVTSSLLPVSAPLPPPPSIRELSPSTSFPPLISRLSEPTAGLSSITTVMNSLVPLSRESFSPIPLPTYIGNTYLAPPSSPGATTSSLTNPTDPPLNYTWSRGLGSDFSPVKTRSTRKKLLRETNPSTVLDSSTTESGALRAVKALARGK
jgi:hypothetical protein